MPAFAGMTENDMTLTLYAHPFASYCWKALIALYENDTPFELRLVDFGNEASAAEFRALWPLAKMPVLVDEGHTIVESSSVIEHLALRHPGPSRLLPDEAAAAIEARMLDRIFDNYVMTPMQKIVGDRLRSDDRRDPQGVADARRLLDTSYAWLEGALAGRTWAAGEAFGLADCAAAPSLHYADKVHPLGDGFPTLAAYQARLAARPSFARVLREAEPYSHLFPQER
jgi:glutathione S-transferase